MSRFSWAKSFWSLVWPILFYLGLTILWTWPLTLNVTTTLPGNGADPLLQAWIITWNAHALQTDPTQIWNAPIFYPYAGTLTYNDHLLFWTIVVFPLLVLGQTVVAYNISFILSFVFTGYGAYLLTRELLRDRVQPLAATIGALLAGALFTFSSYRLAHISHLNLLQMMWLPLTLFWLRRMATSQGTAYWRAALLTGVFAGIQSAVAVYYAPMVAMTLLIVGGVWLWPAHWKRPELQRIIGGAALTGVVIVVIFLPLLWPYVEVYRYLNITRPLLELNVWSAPLQSYLSAPPQNTFYTKFNGIVVTNIHGELTLFPGFIASLLGIIGFIDTVRRKLWSIAIAFFLIIFLSVIFSFGMNLRITHGGEVVSTMLPYSLLYQYLPGFNALRVPARWWMIGSLALSVLAGIGVAALWQQRMWRWGASLLAIIAVMEHLAIPMPTMAVQPLHPVYAWLRQADQAEHRVVLELPLPEELTIATIPILAERQFQQTYHWRSLVVGYSGLTPHGTREILRLAQQLPDDHVIRYFAHLGIDTLIIHRDEFLDQNKLNTLLQWADRSPMLERKVDVGTAVAYAIRPEPDISSLQVANARIWLSDSPDIPDLLALSLLRRWQAAGATVYGAGRLGYYPDLGTLPTKQRFDFVVISGHNNCSAFGGTLDNLVQLDDYASVCRIPSDFLVAISDLGFVETGQYHQRYPANLTATLVKGELHINNRRYQLPEQVDQMFLILETASLEKQTVMIGQQSQMIDPGVQILPIALQQNQPITVQGSDGTFAITRLWGWKKLPSMPTEDKLVIAVNSSFYGSDLEFNLRLVGEAEIVLDIRGVEATTGRHFYLATGVVFVAINGTSATVRLNVFQPDAPWLSRSRSAVDGRYIAYLKLIRSGTTHEVPVAQFQIHNGELVQPQPVPLPLTIVSFD